MSVTILTLGSDEARSTFPVVPFISSPTMLYVSPRYLIPSATQTKSLTFFSFAPNGLPFFGAQSVTVLSVRSTFLPLLFAKPFETIT